LVGNQLTVATFNGGVYHGSVVDFEQPRHSLPGSSNQGNRWERQIYLTNY
jgi:hypothetical protein